MHARQYAECLYNRFRLVWRAQDLDLRLGPFLFHTRTFPVSASCGLPCQDVSYPRIFRVNIPARASVLLDGEHVAHSAGVNRWCGRLDQT